MLRQRTPTAMLSSRSKNILLNIWHWVSSKELLAYLTFVVLATMLWYGHALTSVRNANVQVMLEYTGIPHQIAFTEPLPTKVQIAVRDAGRRLILYRHDSPKLTIDLSGQFTHEHGEIRISEDVLRRGITALLQGTSKLQMVSPEQITGNYYTQQAKTVSIQPHIQVSAASEYLFTKEAELLTPSVTIYGAKQTLRNIQNIDTESLTAEELRDTTDLTLRLILPQGVRAEMETVTMRTIAERYTEKVLTIPVYGIAIPEGKKLRLFPREANVVARVSMNHFSEVNASDIKLRCHYPTHGEDKLPIIVHYTNPYIYGVRVSPQELEFIIEQDDNHEEDTNG